MSEPAAIAGARPPSPESESEDRSRAVVAEIEQLRLLNDALRAEVRELRAAHEGALERERDTRDHVENALVPMHWVGSDGVWPIAPSSRSSATAKPTTSASTSPTSTWIAT
jgi:hypothetical protein